MAQVRKDVEKGEYLGTGGGNWEVQTFRDEAVSLEDVDLRGGRDIRGEVKTEELRRFKPQHLGPWLPRF